MIVLPSIADEPCHGTEHQLESAQDIRRSVGKQTVTAVYPGREKSGDSRLCSPNRQRLDATPDEKDMQSARRTQQENRLLGTEPQFVGTHPFGDPLCA